MGSKTNRLKTTVVLCGGAMAILASATVGHGQSPRYVPPPPPTKNVSFELRLRYLIQPDVSFSGLGSIPLRDQYESEGNIFLGTERLIAYEDGYISQDYIQASLVDGGAEGTDRIPSPNTAASSNFGYRNASQVDPNDPSVLIFHRYASQNDPLESFSGRSSGSLGWELNYTKFLNSKRNLGLQVGFAFTGFDSRFRDSIDADLYVQEFRHRMADGAVVPDLPDPLVDADGNETQEGYQGEVVREDVAIGDLLEWAASEQSDELLLDGAVVESQADLRSSLYNFRAGPTYTTNLFNKVALQLGAGVSALYYAGQLSAYEMLQNPAGGANPSRGLTTTQSEEWQVGGYLDASASYQFTERVNLFSGMQLQSGSTYTQENEERRANVDFSSQVYVHAGIGIRF
jgi:hypothetical protein